MGRAIEKSCDIAIVGMACRFPGAPTTAAFWDLLARGGDAVGGIPPGRWDVDAAPADEDGLRAGRRAGLIEGVDNFDHRFFAVSPREAQAMDPQQRLLLEEAWHCIEDAAVAPDALRRACTAVFVGAMTSDHLQASLAAGVPADSHSFLGACHALMANRISHAFGFHGPSLAIDAAHAASLVAVHHAVRALQAGDADYALAAGVNVILDPWKHRSFAQARMLSPDGRCKAFAADADGYVPGEGVGVVLLQPLDAAQAAGSRVLAVIRASAVNHSGATRSITAPSADAQRAAIERAYAEAGFGPRTVTYIEAHGTGTPMGDAAETAALKQVFGAGDDVVPCHIGSVKTNIGHLEPASGIAGLIKAVLMLRHRTIPRSLHCAAPDPALGLDGSRLRLAIEAAPWEPAAPGLPLRAGVSSFGFGGANAHLLLEAPPAVEAPVEGAEGPAVFELSAKSEASLAALVEAWRGFVATPDFAAARLSDICGTLAQGRERFGHSYALAVADKAELARRLLAGDPGDDVAAAEAPAGWRRIALPQYPFEPAAIPRAGAVPAADAALPPAEGDLAAAARAHLTALLAEKLHCPAAAIGPDDLFADALGVDSFVNMEVIEALEPLAGALPRTLLFDCTTVARLADWLVANRGTALAVSLSVGSGKVPPEAVPGPAGAPAAAPAAAPGAAGEPIAIVGMAGRFAGAPDLDAFWALLAAGRSAIGEVPAARWDLAAHHDPDGRDEDRAYTRWGGFLDDHDAFDAGFFNIAPRQAALMDPQQRLFLEAAWAAMEDAGLTPETLPRATGVFAGVSTNTYGLWAAEEGARGNRLTPDTDLSDVANRVSYFLDLHGPSLGVDTACSASLTALHLAVQGLRAGDCEAAFVGGVNLTLHPSRPLQFCRKEMLRAGPDCHPFGDGEGGFVDGEGVCVLLLKPLSRALADGDHVHGLIRGTAVNSGGRTSGYTVPSPEAQAAMIGRAIERAGVDAATISYVEAHGTGTTLGDPIEIEGLARAFRRHSDDDTGGAGEGQTCAIGSVKANIGHLIAAAGIAGLAKVLLQMRHRTLVPSLNAERPNPHIDFAATPFRVQRALAPWPRRAEGGRELPLRAGVSSFGSGGSNAHAVVEEFVAAAPARALPARPCVVPLSARDPGRLRAVAARLRDFLAAEAAAGRIVALADLAWTLQVGRVAMPARAAFVADTVEALAAALDRYLAGQGDRPDVGDEPHALARRWVAGEAVDWRALWPDGTPRRIPLPTYPFDRTRHWLPMAADGTAHEAERPVAAPARETFCFRPVWTIAPAAPPAGPLVGTTLVLAPADAGPPADAAGLVWVRMGAACRLDGAGGWTIRPDSEADHEALFAALAARGGLPDRVIDLRARDAYGALRDPVGDGLRPLWLLLRAAMRARPARRLEIVVVHPGWVGAGHPKYAAAESLLRAAALENPLIGWRRVEWDSQMQGAAPLPVDAALALALREAGAPDGADTAVRHGLGQRWLRGRAPIDLFAGEPMPVRPGGACLISGGLGGLGRILAEHLAGLGPCRLALVGRRAAGAESEAAIARLEALGAEAIYVAADLGSREVAAEAVAAIRARFGPIHGVIHAAGIKRDGYIYAKGWEEAAETLRPKIDGAVFLDEATRDDPLEFFAMFSSVAAEMHADGLADYAAANGFLEHFAEWRDYRRERGERAGRTLAVAWPLWAEGGMTVPEAAQAAMAAETGLAALPTAEGLRVWDALLAAGEPRCLVLHGDPARLAALGAADISEARAAAPPAGAPARAEDLLARLRALVGEITGHAPGEIDGTQPLALYGLDSVGMRRIVTRLEADFGPLPKSLLLEYPSVDALAAHLAARPAAHAADGGPAPAAPREAAREPRPATAPLAETHGRPGAGDIAIVGYSGRFPGARDADELWANLRAGRDATGEVPAGRWDAAACHDPDPAKAAEGRIYCRWGGFLEDVASFDPLLFELTPAEAATMHPEERLLLESAWTTLEGAGWPRGRVQGRRIGVFVGVNALTYPLLGLADWQESGNAPLDASTHGLANRISYFFGFSGPSVAVDAACASSLVALHQACEAIRAGGCEAAVVGGANLYLHPSKYWMLCRQRLASTTPAFRLFGEGGDGYIPGEGVGTVFLKPLERALADGDTVHGVIRASAVAYKGRSNGYLVPSPRARAELFRETLSQAGVDPASVGYVELQSAGSEMADSAEWSALAEVYGQQGGGRMLGSVKPNIGHLEAASGIAQLIKVLLQIRHGEIAPALVAERRNPDIRPEEAGFGLPDRPAAWPRPEGHGRRAAITATAAGGTEAHLIVEEFVAAEAPATATARGGAELVVLSAQTEERLAACARALTDHLAAGRHRDGSGVAPSLADIAWTLQARRAVFDHRLAVAAADEATLIAALDDVAAGLEPGPGVFLGRRERDGAPDPAADLHEAGDAARAGAAWVRGAGIDWARLTGRESGRLVHLPTYPFERRRCWLYDDKETLPVQPEEPADAAPAGAGAYVADYYNRMTDTLKATLAVEDELYILFAPFAEKVPGFSWLKAFFEPASGREHLDLMLTKQKELKRALYRHVDFSRIESVFDIGCGLATDLIQLARAHPHLRGDGFTITPRQAEEGAARIDRAGLGGRLSVHCADSTRRPFPGVYDLIIGFEVIFHIEDKQAVFANIAEHLSEDGYLILADGVTNTVTEVDMPHLGQFTATAPQFARVLARNGLAIEDCVDTSREISNFLHDAEFEANLAAVNAKYPALREVEAEHRCWDSFGKVLGLGMVRYLLFSIRKARSGWSEDALARENEARIAGATPYREVASALDANTAVIAGRVRGTGRPEDLTRQSQAQAHEMRGSSPRMTISSDAPADAAETEHRLVATAARVWEMEAERIDPSARFVEYGVGSLQGLLLLETVNRELGLALKMPVLYDHSSIRDLARHIGGLGGSSHHVSLADLPHVEDRASLGMRGSPLPASAETSASRDRGGLMLRQAQHEAEERPRPEPVEGRGVGPEQRQDEQPAGRSGIAVVGLAARFPGADDAGAFWRNLVGGVDSVREVAAARWDPARFRDPDAAGDGRHFAGTIDGVDRFDAGFFRLSRREAELMDPQQRLFLEACWTAFEDAGYPAEALSGLRCGVFAGVMGSDYQNLLAGAGVAPEAQMLLGTDDAVLAGRISYFLNLKGPALTLKTACSASLVAAHLACRSLAEGECDMALAGGVTLYLDGKPFVMMSQAGMLSPTGRSRPFDDAADGIAVGDGVGVVVLKRLDDALRDGDRIYGVIRGSAMNQDGRTNGITAPSAESQTALELEVYRRAGIDPDTIGYVEAHGTGTSLGDPIEVAALTEAFRAHTARRGYCALGSVKGNIGHTTAAAGVAGLIKVLLSLEHGLIPPSLHLRTPNRHIDFEASPFFVNTEIRPWLPEEGAPRRAAVSAFGYTGTNCHMVVEAPPAAAARTEAPAPGAHVVPLSARTPEALAEYARLLATALTSTGGARAALADIAWTLQTGRTAMAERLAIVAEDRRALLAGLEAFLAGTKDASVHRGRAPEAGPEGVATVAGDLPPDALADAWVAGAAVDWRARWGERRPRRIALPTYPFARERYWIPGAPEAAAVPRGVAAAPVAGPDPRLACFRPVWRDAPAAEGRPAGALLLLDRTDAHRAALLRAGWPDVVAVTPGAGFADRGEAGFTVDPDREADWRALFAALAASDRAPSCVALVASADAGADPAEAARHLHRLFRIGRALSAAAPAAPVRLLHLRVVPEGLGDPFGPAVAGMARALVREGSRLDWRAVTVADEADIPAVLAAEAATAGGREAAWRGGRRLVRMLEAFEPGRTAPAGFGLREGAVCLIAGGAGGIGTILAEALAREARAKLVLCGRSAPDPGQAARIAALDASGTETLHVRADLADPADVARLVAEAKARFGRIDAVIHAAGVTADAFLANKTDAGIEAVLAPKVTGTLLLDRALRDEPLDAFIVLSSVAAAAGNAGQSDYACANGFLDGFAEWREGERAAGRRHGRTLAIAWPLWAGGGMRIDEAAAAQLRAMFGMEAMPTAAGLDAFRALLAVPDLPRAVVAYGDRPAFEEALRRVEASVPAAAPAGAPSALFPDGELKDAARPLLAGIFADHLRCPVEAIDPHTRFEEYGIDSVMINGFNARMERLIGAFPRTVLFEYQTLDALAGYFAANHADRLAEALGREASEAAAPVPGPREAGVRVRPPHAEEPPQEASRSMRGRQASDDDGGIAIVGIAGRYPQADDLDAFWENLLAGRDCIAREVPGDRWRGAEAGSEIYSRAGGFLDRVDRFDPLFFGISPREAERMDPQERLFLETAWHALEDAAWPPARLAGRRRARGEEVGVFVGVTGGSYALWGPELWRRGEGAIPESMPWSIANRVSFLFDLHGPSMPVDTACSSSLSAVHLACEALRRGDCATALAGGVNLYLHPAKYAQLCQLNMLSRGGRCRSFGEGGDGFVPGEGVGAVLLKPLAAALADGDRIHAVIRGSAVNHGGRTNGFTVPSPQSQAELVRAALRSAGVDPATIGYVEAHGTGTALGDPVEIAGLTAALRPEGGEAAPCAVGSVKSNIGHLESAAGIAGLTKLVLQLRHRTLVPSLHAETLNPNIDFAATPLRVQRTRADWEGPAPRRAGISSFGAGGANAHAIVEEHLPEAPAEAAASGGPFVFVLSARNEDRLRALAARLRRYIEGPAGAALRPVDVAWTLALGREPLAERLAVVAGDLADLAARLRAFEEGAEAGIRGRAKGAAEAPGHADDPEALARAWVGGAAPDWSRLFAGAGRAVSLPGYPFAGKRYWIGESDVAEAPPPEQSPPAQTPPELTPPEQTPREQAQPEGLKALLERLERGEITLDAARGALAGRGISANPPVNGKAPRWNGHDAA